jgi:hypothetical protein
MRRLPLIPLVLALAALAGWSAAAPAPAAANGCSLKIDQGVDGTAADPVLIPDRAALTTLATSGSCFETAYVYRQTADIDLSGSQWTPIAATGAFRGTYDGGGHRITGLDVSVTSGAAGLISLVSGGTVRDLVVVAPRVVNTDPYAGTGALAGGVYAATIERVTVAGGSIRGELWTGGLIGQACSSSLTRGIASAVVSGGHASGGLVGSVASLCPTSVGGVGVSTIPASGAVTDSVASGAVTGTTTVGGLVGQLDGVEIARSLATGAVTASETGAGGLIGRAFGGTGVATPAPADPTAVVDVYATGAVSAPQGGVGGLIGLAQSGVAVTRAYAVGRVSGAPEAGGLVGGDLIGCAGVGIAICSADVRTAQTAASSFWDSATTGQTASHGGYGSAKSTADMQSLATYTAAGWSITRGYSAGATWAICPTANGGYPFLAGGYAASTQPCAGAPAKPAKVTVTSGDGEVTLSWQPPTGGDGGSPVTGYTATATMQRQSDRAGKSCAVAASKRSCTITGLVNGRAYRVALTADNLEGAGTPAVRIVTPRRAMAVLSTTRSGLAVVTRVRVRETGRLTQVGTVAGLGARACRAASAVRRAGVVELRCALTPAALAALAERDLRVRVVTRFAPAAGDERSAVRRVAFARTDAADAVTG